jgi:hypothetical protein
MHTDYFSPIQIAHRRAFREALRDEVRFCYFAPYGKKVVKHNSAIVEAIASARQFSYFK